MIAATYEGGDSTSRDQSDKRTKEMFDLLVSMPAEEKKKTINLVSGQGTHV